MERGAQAPSPVDEVGGGLGRHGAARVDEHLQAHEADDLSRTVDVRVVRLRVVLGAGQVGAHRREERPDQLRVDAALPGGAG